MKNYLLKFGLFFALGLTSAVFYSCDKDDDKGGNTLKITATGVVNGSDQITTVKAIIYLEDSDGVDVMAQAAYKNNGFTLELPATIDVKYLNSIGDFGDIQTITISNKDAKVLFWEDIYGYDKDGNEIGYFYLLEGNENSGYYTSWMYADRNLTITGEIKDVDEYSTYIEKYDLQLKKGWNVVYDSYVESVDGSGKEVDTYSYTTKKPAGVNYSWIFYSYEEDFRSAKVDAKSVEKNRSAFSKLK